MTEHDITVVAIDDHPVILGGLREALSHHHGLDFRAGFASLEQALTEPPADVVLLDLILGDDSRPRDNVRRLIEHGSAVVIYTQGSRQSWMSEALSAGALGVVLKSYPVEELVASVRAAAVGALHVRPDLGLALRWTAQPRPQLARREAEVLRLAASGLLYHQIADQLGITRETVKTYIKRIRSKYAAAGRDARTRLKLRDLAVEDGYWSPTDDGAGHELEPDSA